MQPVETREKECCQGLSARAAMLIGAGLGAGIGAGLGAGLMYLFDPDRGKRRRTQIMDHANSTYRRGVKAVERTVDDVENRVHGVVAELEGMFHEEGDIPDVKLEARVRSKLGRVVDHPHGIDVFSREGRIYLRGALTEEQAAKVEEAVRTVPGVKDVVAQFASPATVG